jgi:hypothetical protein
MLTAFNEAVLYGLEVKEKRHQEIVNKLQEVTDGKISWDDYTQWYARGFSQ